MGKILIIIGLVLVVTGLLLQYSNKIPFLGKLPGDIRIERENVSFYIPIATSVLLSIILTIILYLVNKFRS
jgi:thiosulfate reductase cytochrome b subunit